MDLVLSDSISECFGTWWPETFSLSCPHGMINCPYLPHDTFPKEVLGSKEQWVLVSDGKVDSRQFLRSGDSYGSRRSLVQGHLSGGHSSFLRGDGTHHCSHHSNGSHDNPIPWGQICTCPAGLHIAGGGHLSRFCTMRHKESSAGDFWKEWSPPIKIVRYGKRPLSSLPSLSGVGRPMFRMATTILWPQSQGNESRWHAKSSWYSFLPGFQLEEIIPHLHHLSHSWLRILLLAVEGIYSESPGLQKSVFS